MTQHLTYIMETVRAAALGMTDGLQVHQLLYQTEEWGLLEWVTEGDVHLIYLLWQGVDDGRQQTFVSEYDGGLSACLVSAYPLTVFLLMLLLHEPVIDIASLHILSWCTDEGDALFTVHIVVDGIVLRMVTQLVAIYAKILTYVVSCLILDVAIFSVERANVSMIVHIILVVIPVEMAICLAFELGIQLLLYLLHHIETDEEVGLVFECNLLVFSHLAIECTLVGKSLRLQSLVEICIDFTKVTPELQESFLKFTVLVVTEVAEELLEYLALLLGEVTIVIERVKVFHIEEYLLCVSHVLVDVVEVG